MSSDSWVRRGESASTSRNLLFKVASLHNATTRLRRAQKADAERDSIRLLFTAIDYDTSTECLPSPRGEGMRVLVLPRPSDGIGDCHLVSGVSRMCSRKQTNDRSNPSTQFPSITMCITGKREGGEMRKPGATPTLNAIHPSLHAVRPPAETAPARPNKPPAKHAIRPRPREATEKTSWRFAGETRGTGRPDPSGETEGPVDEVVEKKRLP